MDAAVRRPALGIWRRGSAGLAILDYAATADTSITLPERDNWIIAGDVRLDESEQLRTTLGASKAASDDALVLEALANADTSQLTGILGDFAFAIWSPVRQHLVLGRDTIGARPLAYAYRAGEFLAFASFPKAIHGSQIVPRKMDDGAVARRIARVISSEECLMEGIKRLPPAHVLELTPAGIRITQYWQIDRTVIGKRKTTQRDAAAELRSCIEQAVRSRLPRNGGGVATHLSGGLDSSAITVLAARALGERGQRLHTYSLLDRLRNDLTSNDETEYVRAVIQQEPDLAWTAVRAETGMAAPQSDADADKISPFSSTREESAICADAARKGVDLILTGLGGDEGASYGGSGLIGDLLLRGRWRSALREINILRRTQHLSFARVAYREVLRHFVPSVIDAALHSDRGPPPLIKAFPLSLLPEIRKRYGARRSNDRWDAVESRTARWLRMTSPHMVERMEHWALLGAKHGVAYTHPLLDRRVISFAMSLPAEIFRSEGKRRRVFRDAMADVLPDRVRCRTDKLAPFPLRMVEFVDHKEELVSRLEACSRDPNVRRLIDLDLLRRQLDEFPNAQQIRADYRDDRTEQIRQHVARITAALHTLAGAEYILQYGKTKSVADK
ncbi:MAG: asparagine synthase-related protein [Rhizomicrobium sp.]|nr:asparagine synthase-related protein [Rhizomicrobium sp.]